MGMRTPAETDMHVFAVEVRENLTFGERFSPELEEALPELVADKLTEIEALLVESRPAGSGPGAGFEACP